MVCILKRSSKGSFDQTAQNRPFIDARNPSKTANEQISHFSLYSLFNTGCLILGSTHLAQHSEYKCERILNENL